MQESGEEVGVVDAKRDFDEDVLVAEVALLDTKTVTLSITRV